MQAVANMLWGLARLQLCHTDLLDRLEKRTMQLLKLQKAQGDTEGGGAEYPANPPRVSWPGLGLPTRSFWQQQGFKAQEVSMTVWALANLGRSPPPDLLQEALRHVCKQVRSCWTCYGILCHPVPIAIIQTLPSSLPAKRFMVYSRSAPARP